MILAKPTMTRVMDDPRSEVPTVLCYNSATHGTSEMCVEKGETMDRIKGMLNDLTGGDGNVDSSDIKAQIGDLGLDDLKDLSFPITKAEVLETLRNNGSSSLLINAVEKVPADTFNSLNDLKAKLPL